MHNSILILSHLSVITDIYLHLQVNLMLQRRELLQQKSKKQIGFVNIQKLQMLTHTLKVLYKLLLHIIAALFIINNESLKWSK